MVVLGYIDRVKHNYSRYLNGECPDGWRSFCDESYNPRHVPTLLSTVILGSYYCILMNTNAYAPVNDYDYYIAAKWVRS